LDEVSSGISVTVPDFWVDALAATSDVLAAAFLFDVLLVRGLAAIESPPGSGEPAPF